MESKVYPARLTGTENAVIDSKGRLLFSKAKRDVLKSKFCICVGSSGCLEVMTREKWEEMAEMIEKHDSFNQGRKQLARLFFGNSELDCEFDSSGRVVIPAKLRKAAGIDTEVTIVGVGSSAEIWDRATYEKYEEDPGSYFHKNEMAYETAYLKMRDRWPELPQR